jgi:hypothetical protein
MVGVNAVYNLVSWRLSKIPTSVAVGLISTLLLMYTHEAYWACGEDGTDLLC